ncbi:MAG: hypothetical protein AAFR53_05575 [Pseudomonadota bacterium]
MSWAARLNVSNFLDVAPSGATFPFQCPAFFGSLSAQDKGGRPHGTHNNYAQKTNNDQEVYSKDTGQKHQGHRQHDHGEGSVDYAEHSYESCQLKGCRGGKQSKSGPGRARAA